MTPRAYYVLLRKLVKQTGLPYEACDDLIDEVERQITELREGHSNYHSIEEIVVDYLQLPMSWARLFIE